MNRIAAPLLLSAAAFGVLPAAAQTQQGTAATEQVVEPDVARREVKLPRFPSKDFGIGAYVGSYSAQNFGTSFVYGARLEYHLTEDFFAEGVYAQTKVTDADFRLILPGGIFPQKEETLSYYSLSIGYNVLPGEVFFGRNVAKASAVYVLAGVGSTQFLEQRRQTLTFGLGMRVLPWDRFAIQVDVRDHLYSLDLLGERDTRQDIELTVGLTYYFW